ncbi:MAG: PLP-dependent transferase, partial [Pseudomonadota bacterium]
VTANARCFDQLRRDNDLLGQAANPEDAYLALRGLRTAAARLAMHADHARTVADWLAQQPQVEAVLYPPREGDPGHSLWVRDFDGANGLLSVVFRDDIAQADVNRCVDQLRLFGLGASWGGFESLVMVYGNVPGWSGGRVMRLHIGLENPADLIEDLARGFAAM